MSSDKSGVFAGLLTVLGAVLGWMRPGIVLDVVGLAFIVVTVAVLYGAWGWLAAGFALLLISWRYAE